MNKIDFNGTIIKAAQSVKQSTRCSTHNKEPNFTAVKTDKGADIEWKFCCDEFAEIVKDKFKSTSKNLLGEAVSASLKDALK